MFKKQNKTKKTRKKNKNRNNSPDKSFKILVTKMLTELGMRIDLNRSF